MGESQLGGNMGRPTYDWRDSFLAAAILWGSFLTLLTEALSLFHALAPLPPAPAWTAATPETDDGCRT